MVENMPFGGVGMAGMGHYYEKYGFDMLTHAKSMLISPRMSRSSTFSRRIHQRKTLTSRCGSTTEIGGVFHEQWPACPAASVAEVSEQAHHGGVAPRREP